MGVHNFNNTWLNALLTKKQQASAKIQICSRQRCRKSNFEQRSISKFIAVQVIPRTCGWYLRSLDVLQLVCKVVFWRALLSWIFSLGFEQPIRVHFTSHVATDERDFLTNELRDKRTSFHHWPRAASRLQRTCSRHQTSHPSPSSSCSSQLSFSPRRWSSTRLQLNSHWHRCQPSHSHHGSGPKKTLKKRSRSWHYHHRTLLDTVSV